MSGPQIGGRRFRLRRKREREEGSEDGAEGCSSRRSLVAGFDAGTVVPIQQLPQDAENALDEFEALLTPGLADEDTLDQAERYWGRFRKKRAQKDIFSAIETGYSEKGDPGTGVDTTSLPRIPLITSLRFGGRSSYTNVESRFQARDIRKRFPTLGAENEDEDENA